MKIDQKLYRKTGPEYLKTHCRCEVEGCTARADDLHHKAGRIGFLKWWPKFFMAVCRHHHDQIHFRRKKWAIEKGYLIYVTGREMRELKPDALRWAEQKGIL